MSEPFTRPTTTYFVQVVLARRPYLTPGLIEGVLSKHAARTVQEDGRVRYFGRIESMDNRWLRIVLLEDDKTLHNAFLDRDGPTQTEPTP